MVDAGRKTRADPFTSDDPFNHIGERAWRNHHIDTTLGSQIRRLDFGHHPAGATNAPRSTGERVYLRGYCVDRFDQRRRWITARVGSIQPVDIRQDQQHVGIDQICYQRRKVVIVADFDFVDGDCVVFVDDGKDPMGKARQQRIAGVEIATAIADVGFGQERLPHRHRIQFEHLLIEMHDERLTDRGQHLFFGDITRARLHRQTLTPGSNRAGRDQNDFMTLCT